MFYLYLLRACAYPLCRHVTNYKVTRANWSIYMYLHLFTTIIPISTDLCFESIIANAKTNATLMLNKVISKCFFEVHNTYLKIC